MLLKYFYTFILLRKVWQKLLFGKSMAKTTFWKKVWQKLLFGKSMAKTTFWKKYGKNYL
jgi:hypothetical protein